MDLKHTIKQLKSMANPENVRGMARYGINPDGTLGIQIFKLRDLAKKIGKNHELALKLYNSGIHEAKILASLIDEPDKVTKAQMENWALKFDSWDVCDGVCHLFELTPYQDKLILEWTKRKEEFVKRSGFNLMTYKSVHDKKAPDSVFINYLPIIKHESTDERNYVKKAVNWALRAIGKRNLRLRIKALKTAEEIKKLNSKSARWIAGDAIRELNNPKIMRKIKP